MPDGKGPSFLKSIALGTATIATLILTGCAGYHIVEEKDYQNVAKINGGEYELVNKAELAQLKTEAAIGRSVGRYQVYSRGFRTWRLDTATGEACLLLTTEADWKKPDTTARSCY